MGFADLDRSESDGEKLALVLILGQRPCNAAGPLLHVLAGGLVHVGIGDHVADREPAAGAKYPGCLAKDAGLLPERLMTQLEMTTSTDSSDSGISSIVPLRNSTFSTPASAWLRRASSSISSVMSSPKALPVGPTRCAESKYVDAASGPKIEHRLAFV